MTEREITWERTGGRTHRIIIADPDEPWEEIDPDDPGEAFMPRLAVIDRRIGDARRAAEGLEYDALQARQLVNVLWDIRRRLIERAATPRPQSDSANEEIPGNPLI